MYVLYQLIGGLARRGAARAGLYGDDGVDQILGLTVVKRDRGVAVQPKHLHMGGWMGADKYGTI